MVRRSLGVVVGVFLLLGLGASTAASASAASEAAWAWGFNQYRQLGDGNAGGGQECPTMEHCSATPVATDLGANVRAVAGGEFHSLALLENGTVMAWGQNTLGQLGNESVVSSTAEPVPVSGLTEVIAISAGTNHSLALLANGKVMAWGQNQAGQLGDGTTTNRATPVEVTGLEHVKAISAGWTHSLALLENGTVMAWGSNDTGQLGDESNVDSHVPVKVAGLTGVTAIAAGGFQEVAPDEQSLALLSDGRVMAWGSNEYGQLGDESAGDESDVPVEVSDLSDVTAIAAGSRHSLALLSSGAVMAWGWNEEGQLGVGTESGPDLCGEDLDACSLKPLEVHGVTNATAVSAGWFYSVALLANGTATTWGGNTYDELGDNTGVLSSDEPVPVSYLTGIDAIAGGGEHVLALRPSTSAPEFGRCIKVANETGRFTNATCTAGGTSAESSHEWYPGVAAPHFSTAGGSAVFESVGGFKVSCSSESGTGQYSGPQTLANVILVFQGCKVSITNSKCSTSGAALGEVVTTALDGRLGLEQLSSEGAQHNKVALRLAPAAGETVAALTCGTSTVSITGSVLAPIPTNKASTTAKRKYKASLGKQKPEAFEGGPTSVLHAAFFGFPSEQTGLTVEVTETDEEATEVNSVV